MVRLLRFAVVLLVIYVVWDQARPWFQSQLGSPDPGAVAEGPARCTALGDRANDTFGERVGRVSGIGDDVAAWEQFMGDVKAQIADAQRGCRCAKTSCEKVQQAMTELEDLVDQLDMRFRGEPTRGNPVQRQIGVNELLNEARALARQGS